MRIFELAVLRMGKVVGMCEEETPGRQDVIRLDLTGSSGRNKRQLDSLLKVDQPIIL